MIPRKFDDAVEYISSKVVQTKDWNAEDWASQKGDIATRSFFSANVENARFLNRGKKLITDFQSRAIEEIELEDGTKTMALKVGSRADFVRQMREFMIKEGMLSEDELDRIKQESDGDVTELASRYRLNLIFDTSVRSAWGYGHYRQGMRPAILKAFPAARFIRIPGAEEPRERHQAHEGDVRLKWDNAWWADYQNAADLGGFEVPWAPYGYNSYMEQEDVSRKVAIKQGIISSEEMVPIDAALDFNHNLKAGTKTLDPELKKSLLEKLNDSGLLGLGVIAVTELARRAAENARRKAIERSLKKAQERGDTAEVERIQKILDRERSVAPKFVDRGGHIEIDSGDSSVEAGSWITHKGRRIYIRDEKERESQNRIKAVLKKARSQKNVNGSESIHRVSDEALQKIINNEKVKHLFENSRTLREGRGFRVDVPYGLVRKNDNLNNNKLFLDREGLTSVKEYDYEEIPKLFEDPDTITLGEQREGRDTIKLTRKFRGLNLEATVSNQKGRFLVMRLTKEKPHKESS